MASIRTRLTFAYAITMSIVLVGYAIALSMARRERGYQDLGQIAITSSDQLIALMREARRSGDSLTTLAIDSAIDPHRPVVKPTQRLRGLLEPLDGHFVVLDWEDRILIRSGGVRQMNDTAQAALARVGASLRPGARAAVVELPSLAMGPMLLVARRDTAATGRHISRLVVGVPTGIAELSSAMLAGTALMLAPLVLVLAIAAAVYVSRGTFKPVDEVIAELGAITDGRSLHRRLPGDQSDEELARLTSTLNAMISRLESSFSGLRRFTADASHELKTPLTVLRANVERAMSPRTSSTERMVALEEALQEVARMTDLVDSLLTLARADEGRFDIHREPVELEPLVRDVFETAQILGEDAGIVVSLPVAENAVVSGDPVRLRQLFLNLVTNAIKYTPRGGRVDVGLRRIGEAEVAFSVRDTGVGISAAELPHIFDRFWRADRARSRASERGGFGLGLSIAQWIAHAHGGTLTATSRLGRGSVFTVTLPVPPAAEEEESEPVMKRA